MREKNGKQLKKKEIFKKRRLNTQKRKKKEVYIVKGDKEKYKKKEFSLKKKVFLA